MGLRELDLVADLDPNGQMDRLNERVIAESVTAAQLRGQRNYDVGQDVTVCKGNVARLVWSQASRLVTQR